MKTFNRLYFGLAIIALLFLLGSLWPLS